jgi:hypothetical protein
LVYDIKLGVLKQVIVIRKGFRLWQEIGICGFSEIKSFFIRRHPYFLKVPPEESGP